MEPNNSGDQNQTNATGNIPPAPVGNISVPTSTPGSQLDPNVPQSNINQAAASTTPESSTFDTNTSINSAFTADINMQQPQTSPQPTQNFNTPAPTDPNNPNLTIVNNVPKHKKSPVVAVLIVFLIVLLVGGGAAAYFILNKSKNSSDSEKTTNQTSNSATKESETSSDSIYTGWKSYTSASTGLSFKYPSKWVLTDGNADGSIMLRSEEPIDDETVNDRPLSKNIYFQLTISPTNNQKIDETITPSIFRTIKFTNDKTATVYKQLTSANAKTAAEIYTMADDNKQLIIIGTKNTRIDVNGQFNAMQSDYDVILPLKENGTFVADERQEVKDFLNILKSMSY